MPFYSNVEHQQWWPLFQLGMAGLFTIMALFTGLLVALGGTFALRFLALPVLLLLGLILWMLPDVDRPVAPPFAKLALGYVAMRAETPEEELGAPLAMSLLCFVLACYVVSSNASNYLAFMMAVAAVALHRRQELRLAAAGKALPAPRQPGTALARRPTA